MFGKRSGVSGFIGLVNFCREAWGHDFVGMNFALGFQREPLEISMACGILRARYPGVMRAKLFDSDTATLAALWGCGFTDVVVTAGNGELASIIEAAIADGFVQKLQPFCNEGMRITVAIGNEPFASWKGGLYDHLVVPALESIRAAANRAQLSLKFTVPFIFQLERGYPPSSAQVLASHETQYQEIARMLMETSSSFSVNLYPYFTRASQPADIPLDYALGNAGASIEGVDYVSLLDAQIATLRHALLRLSPEYTEANLPIWVTETGWPTKGGSTSTDASVANAKAFVDNVVAYALEREQTVFLFEAFDEQLKSTLNSAGTGTTDSIEDNWGLFYESGVAKYTIAGLWVNGSGVDAVAVDQGHSSNFTAVDQAPRLTAWFLLACAPSFVFDL